LVETLHKALADKHALRQHIDALGQTVRHLHSTDAWARGLLAAIQSRTASTTV
jgi:hypothetical protein